MNEQELPPLPEPCYPVGTGKTLVGYSRSQMREYARAALLAHLHARPLPVGEVTSIAQKPTVTHLMRLAVAMRHAPSDGYDDAYKCLQNALYAALPVGEGKHE